MSRWCPQTAGPVGACSLAPSVQFAPGHRRIGYDASSYRIDSLKNSVSDILFLLLGWLVAQVTRMLVPSRAAFWVLMGVAVALFLAFVYLFTKERALWKAGTQRTTEGADGAFRGACSATATTLPRIVGGSAGGVRSSRWPGTAAPRATPVAAPAAGARPRVQFVL